MFIECCGRCANLGLRHSIVDVFAIPNMGMTYDGLCARERLPSKESASTLPACSVTDLAIRRSGFRLESK